MCEYCSCRTQPSIARLGEEHERIEALTVTLRAAHRRDDRAGVAEVAARILDVLGPHVAREEQALFPELAAAGVNDHVMALETDHEVLDEAFVAFAEGRATAAEWQALPEIVDRLEDHIWREEYDVFPAAIQLLDPMAWQRVEDGSAVPA